MEFEAPGGSSRSIRFRGFEDGYMQWRLIYSCRGTSALVGQAEGSFFSFRIRFM